METTYITTKRVRHAGKRYGIGREISLAPQHADDLLAFGAIKLPEAVMVIGVPAPAVILSDSTLAKLSKNELIEYAIAHNLTPSADATKDDLLIAIAEKTASMQPEAVV